MDASAYASCSAASSSSKAPELELPRRFRRREIEHWIEMTTRYAHLSLDARRDAVKVLDVKEPITLTWTTSKGVIFGSRSVRRAGLPDALWRLRISGSWPAPL